MQNIQYFLLLTVLLAFGPSYQSFSLASPLALALLYRFMRSQRSHLTVFIVTVIASFIGTFFAYAGSFEVDHAPSYKSLNTYLALPVALVFSLLFTIGAFLDRLTFLYVRPPGLLDTFLAFPAIWTALWCIVYRVSIFGDFGTWHSALAVIEFEPLTRGVSYVFGSFSGGCYIGALLAVLLNNLFDVVAGINSSKSIISGTSFVDNEKVKSLKYGVTLLTLLTLVGSMIGIVPGSFYQTPINKYAPKYVDASCVVGGTYRHVELILEKSSSKIVLMSELSLLVKNENQTLDKFRELSQRYNAVIGVSYAANSTTNPGKIKNMFALVVPPFENKTDATVAFTYQKAHPVPGVEADVEAGKPKLQYANTPYGTIGAAICFDFNFPFLNQVAKTNVSLMLQPSYTWGPIGYFHARVNRLRAIEHGFTTFRCATYGFSGVYGSRGDVMAETMTLGFGEHFNTRIPIQPKFWTFFGFTGDVLGLFCTAVLTYWLTLLSSVGFINSKVYKN